MKIYIHQTHHTIGDFKSILTTIKSAWEDKKNTTEDEPQIHIFPELFLTGYPLGDLILYKGFIQKYLELIKEINKWSLSLRNEQANTLFLLGGPSYNFDKNPADDNDELSTIENSVFSLEIGKTLEKVYSKKLLPHYDIFDESKYFIPGNINGQRSWKGFNFFLLLCEDMWPKNTYNVEPISQIDGQIPLNAIFNLSASPFEIGKLEVRLEKSNQLAQFSKCPVFYINRVGGEDEILFDGQSFVIDPLGEKIIAKSFKEDCIEISIKQDKKYSDLPLADSIIKKDFTWRTTHLWETSNLEISNHQLVIDALCFGIKEYAKKNRMDQFIVGLSGGLDSALVLALLSLCFKKEKIHAVFLPSKHTSILSHDLATNQCQKLGIKLIYYPIKFLQSSMERQFEVITQHSLTGTSYENLQSRIRGLTLYALSNHLNAMVLNTSNKSEISVGYSTLYGDSVGAISPLGDLYKTQVTELANFLYEKYDGMVLKEIIDRPASAELKDHQLDQDSLPPYHILDAILDYFLSQKFSQEMIVSKGYREEDVEKTIKLFEQSEFKRKQFPLIIKVQAKSFGFGHRMPLSKHSSIFSP